MCECDVPSDHGPCVSQVCPLLLAVSSPSPYPHPPYFDPSSPAPALALTASWVLPACAGRVERTGAGRGTRDIRAKATASEGGTPEDAYLGHQLADGALEVVDARPHLVDLGDDRVRHRLEPRLLAEATKRRRTTMTTTMNTIVGRAPSVSFALAIVPVPILSRATYHLSQQVLDLRDVRGGTTRTTTVAAPSTAASCPSPPSCAPPPTPPPTPPPRATHKESKVLRLRARPRGARAGARRCRVRLSGRARRLERGDGDDQIQGSVLVPNARSDHPVLSSDFFRPW